MRIFLNAGIGCHRPSGFIWPRHASYGYLFGRWVMAENHRVKGDPPCGAKVRSWSAPHSGTGRSRLWRSNLRQATCAYSSGSNRPCQGLVQPPWTSRSCLGPLEGLWGPRQDLCVQIREGASGERSVCTSNDGLSFGRRAMCLAEPLRLGGRQPPKLATKLTY